MKNIINIPTTEDLFYQQYFSLLNPLLPERLSPQEIELFAELNKLYNYYGDIPLEEKNLLIFNATTTKKIILKLDFKRAVYDNLIVKLKKKRFILESESTGDKQVNPAYAISMKENSKLTFNFTIK